MKWLHCEPQILSVRMEQKLKFPTWKHRVNTPRCNNYLRCDSTWTRARARHPKLASSSASSSHAPATLAETSAPCRLQKTLHVHKYERGDARRPGAPWASPSSWAHGIGVSSLGAHTPGPLQGFLPALKPPPGSLRNRPLGPANNRDGSGGALGSSLGGHMSPRGALAGRAGQDWPLTQKHSSRLSSKQEAMLRTSNRLFL